MGFKKKVWILSIFLCLQKTSSWTSLFFGGGTVHPPPVPVPFAKWPFKSFHRYSVFAAWPPYLAASSPPPRPHVRRRCEHKSRSCQKKNRPNISEKPLKIGDGNLIGSRIFFFQFAIASFGKCWPKLIYCWWWKKFRRTHQLRLVRLSHDFVVYQKNWETSWDMAKNPANWRDVCHFCARV